ncbi:unnamed protein product, partial [Closterium sp. NIES-53]
MGPLSSRLQTLCLANATAAISRLSLRVVWLKDEGMIYVPPSEILLGGGGGASGGSAGGGSGRSRGKFSWGRREPKRGAGGEVTMAGERGGGGAKGGGRGGGPVVIDTGGALSPITATRAAGAEAQHWTPQKRSDRDPPSPFPLPLPSPSPQTPDAIWAVRAQQRSARPLRSGAALSGRVGLPPSRPLPCNPRHPSLPFSPHTHQMRFGQCGRSSAVLDPSEAERLSLDVWVSVRALNRTNFEKVVGCLVLEEFHRCYARLQPSETVRGIVESTNLNMTLVTQSTAIYVD